MDKISNRLTEAMEKANLSQSDLVRLTGINKGALSSYINGRYEPKQRAIYELAKALNVNEAWLLGYDVPKERTNYTDSPPVSDQQIYQSAGLDYILVPLYNPICCGNGGFVDDNIIEYVPVPSKGLSPRYEYFAQYAIGDSMSDAGIKENDLLVFQKTSSISSGSIGCFCIDENEAMCKKYKEQQGIIMLQPMNSAYEPIIVNPSDACFKCLGLLKKIIKDVD